MALFVWSQIYLVNIAKIDEQHRALVDTINQLNEAMLQRQSVEVLGSVIKQLITYTVEHFDYEENLMSRYDYPGLDEHREKHQEMRDWVAQLQSDYEHGRFVASIRIMDYLRNWLAEHILGTDQLYKDFFHNEGVG